MRDEILTRITQQGKCIELSIIITSGLLAAIAGAQWRGTNPTDSDAFPLAFAGLAVYCFLQGSLLTNYMYQRWLIGAIHDYILVATETHAEEILRSPTLGICGWERHMRAVSRYGVARGTADIVELCQPILIYGALTLGVVLLSVLCVLADTDALTPPAQVAVWGIYAFVLGCTVTIAYLHRAICVRARMPVGSPRPKPRADRTARWIGLVSLVLLAAACLARPRK